jgi:hypothetical protein
MKSSRASSIVLSKSLKRVSMLETTLVSLYSGLSGSGNYWINLMIPPNLYNFLAGSRADFIDIITDDAVSRKDCP